MCSHGRCHSGLGPDFGRSGSKDTQDFPTFLQEPDVDSKCANVGNIDPDCWVELELSAYAHWWWFDHMIACGSKSFSECFLSQTAGTVLSDCNHIDPKSCLLASWDSTYKGHFNAVRNFYIAYNIVAMNGFFTNYYHAVDQAQGLAAGKIGAMVDTINPQHDAKESNLNFALDILAIPMGIAGLVPIEGEWLKVMMEGLNEAVDATKELIPDDLDASNVGEQLLDWANVANSLSDLTGAIEVRLNNALGKTMSDVETFISLGNNKAFSYDLSQMPDTETMKQAIVKGLMTFAASQLYQLTGHVLTMAPNTTSPTSSTTNSSTGIQAAAAASMAPCPHATISTIIPTAKRPTAWSNSTTTRSTSDPRCRPYSRRSTLESTLLAS